jgi:hypothetical protein
MNYYFEIADQRVGPLSAPEIQEKISQGKVDLYTLAWTEGMKDWLQVRNLPELLSAFPELDQAAKAAEMAPPPLPAVRYTLIGAGIAAALLLILMLAARDLLGACTVLIMVWLIYQAYKFNEERRYKNARGHSLLAAMYCGFFVGWNFWVGFVELALYELGICIALLWVAKQLLVKPGK